MAKSKKGSKRKKNGKTIEKQVQTNTPEPSFFTSFRSDIILLALFSLSGISGLVYQVVWVRILKLIFGVTAFAASTVVSSYMAGLSIGSFYFGRVVDRTKNRIKLYALLEIGIGLYALFTPFIFKNLDLFYTVIYGWFSPNFYVFSLIRFLLAFIIILIPTVLMGGTLPVLIKYFATKIQRVGKVSGYLYSFNTFGAVIGAFAAGFFLVKFFGVLVTIYIAAAINITIGIAAFFISRREVKKTGPPVVAGIELQPIRTLSNPGKRTYKLLIWGFAFSGLASLAYEILWTRSLLYFLGLTTYTFTTILTTFLIGIALGSFIFSRTVDKIKDHLTWFAVIEILLGLTALAVIPMISKLYHISYALRQTLGYNSWWANVGVKFILSFMVMLLPTLLMGATFPVVVKCYNRDIKGLGKEVGEIYAANTVGSIIGAFIAGFILIPLFGLRLSMSLVVLVNLFIGLTVIILHPGLKKNNRTTAIVVTVMILVVVLLNVNRKPVIMASVEFTGPSKRYDLLYFKEGIDASIAVLQDKVNGERELNINGESTAFTIYQDMQVHKLLGHLPLLVHPNPQNALIVGFGFGSTSWATMLYPEIRTNCVELVKDEIETAVYFEKQNHNVLAQSRFNMIIADGREYIKGTKKRYDMISFNAIHPKISPNLYTLDFYKMCRGILSETGIIIAWLPPNAITEVEYQSLIKTFCQVFPYSSLWYVNPSHMLLMATPEPLKIDYKLLRERLAEENIKNDLAEVNLDDPYELLSCFIMAGDDLTDYSKNAPVNSDDFPYIEFSREMTVSVNTAVMTSLGNRKKSVWPYLYDVSDSTLVRRDLARMDNTKSLVARGQVMAWLGRYHEARSYYRQALEQSPGNRNALYLDGLINRRRGELQKLINLNPGNAKAVQALGEIYLEEKDIRKAFNMFNRAVQLDPKYAQAHHHLGVCYFMQNRPDMALPEFKTAMDLDPEYGAAYFYAGLCYWKMGQLDPALQNFKISAEKDRDFAPSHYYLALAFERKGQISSAVTELERTLLLDPSFEAAKTRIQALKKRQ